MHAEELFKWNKKINLTAITNPFQIAEKHFIDSLLCCGQIKKGSKVIDIGSGGGFPGLPIKFFLPETSISLVDSSQKKVNFLKHVIRTCSLDKIEAVHTRIESLKDNKKYAIQYDYVVSRAFTQIPALIEKGLPVLKNGGSIIALKSKNIFNEINKEIKKHFSIETKKYILPFENSDRYIIKITSKT